MFNDWLPPKSSKQGRICGRTYFLLECSSSFIRYLITSSRAYVQARVHPSTRHQCDQKKLPKNVLSRKMIDFNTYTKIA